MGMLPPIGFHLFGSNDLSHAIMILAYSLRFKFRHTAHPLETRSLHPVLSFTLRAQQFFRPIGGVGAQPRKTQCARSKISTSLQPSPCTKTMLNTMEVLKAADRLQFGQASKCLHWSIPVKPQPDGINRPGVRHRNGHRPNRPPDGDLEQPLGPAP